MIMDCFEIRDSLSTFRVIADTREQNTPRAKERFEALGDHERATLAYTDYCGQITLPTGDLYDITDELLNTDTPTGLFLLMFVLYGAVYVAALCISRYLGTQNRIISRAELRRGEVSENE